MEDGRTVSKKLSTLYFFITPFLLYVSLLNLAAVDNIIICLYTPISTVRQVPTLTLYSLDYIS